MLCIFYYRITTVIFKKFVILITSCNKVKTVKSVTFQPVEPSGQTFKVLQHFLRIIICK